MADVKKVTVEIEVSEGDYSLEKLLEDLRKGVPLGIKKRELRRSRIYAKRTRY